MYRLLASVIIITAVTFAGFKLSNAFFSDTEASTNNTFVAGDVDLKVDNTSYYNGQPNPGTTWLASDLTPDNGPSTGGSYRFFDFNDIKPSDHGEDTISLHVQTNDAWGCYEVSLTSNNDVSCTEPEVLDDLTCSEPNDDLFDGELADTVEIVVWVDDGDSVLEADEVGNILTEGNMNQAFPSLRGALADSNGGILNLQGQPMSGETTYYIAKAWCFGDLATNPVGADLGVDPTVASGVTCDGANLNNATQTDTLTADVSFSVVQSRNNLDYVCPGQISCQEIPAYAAATNLNQFAQGLRKNDTQVAVDRSDPNKALGGPENVVTPPSFVSLGFGGSIVVSFANPVGNGAGGDLTIHEITNGRTSYPEEKAKVEVSQNGATWFEIGFASSKDPNGTVSLDIDNGAPQLETIQYVRLTDVSVEGPFEATADGYDLDAVEAIYGVCEENVEPAF